MSFFRYALIFLILQTCVCVQAQTEDPGAVINDPLPAKIQKAGLTLKLQEFTTAPATAINNPKARINQMFVLKGKVDRLFILDLRGKLYELKNKIFHGVLDLGKKVPAMIDEPGLNSGFGSFAFHPDFYKNGLFYTTHTEEAGSAVADYAYADSISVALQWVVTEWKIKDPSAAVFSMTGRELLRIDMPTSMHGVQQIIFNPLAKPGSKDYGLLYIGIGDGGSAESGYAQLCDNTQIRASVLRIDPKGRNSRNGKYGLPEINPYAADRDLTTPGEVFARGFRNPNRISWSPEGKMLISDIGLNNIEELNIGNAGADYGWPAREGTFLLNYKGKMNKVYALPEADQKYTYPVAQYDHDEGNAISAGFVYTGVIPILKGKYIFGDIVRGRIFYVENNELELGKQAVIKEFDLEFNGKAGTFRDIVKNNRTDIRLGLGLKNELYIFSKVDGKIWMVGDCTANKQ